MFPFWPKTKFAVEIWQSDEPKVPLRIACEYFYKIKLLYIIEIMTVS